MQTEISGMTQNIVITTAIEKDIKEVAVSSDINSKNFDMFLLTKLKDGDEDAFRHIFTRWEKPLFHFIRKIVGSEQDAEDICQETFTALWLTHSSIDPGKNIKTYIFLIAKQVAWKYFRENKRRESFLADPGFDSDDSLSPEDIAQLKETELLAEYAISKLPARTREIYRLHYTDNLSYEQIAARLNTNPVNVKTQIYQARKKIREIMAIVLMALFTS